jgi:hypothetical protein
MPVPRRCSAIVVVVAAFAGLIRTDVAVAAHAVAIEASAGRDVGEGPDVAEGPAAARAQPSPGDQRSWDVAAPSTSEVFAIPVEPLEFAFEFSRTAIDPRRRAAAASTGLNRDDAEPLPSGRLHEDAVLVQLAAREAQIAATHGPTTAPRPSTNADPLAWQPLDVAFGLSRPGSHVENRAWGGMFRFYPPRWSRLDEARMLDSLAAREREIAAALSPSAGAFARESAPREILGKPQLDRVVNPPRTEDVILAVLEQTPSNESASERPVAAPVVTAGDPWATRLAAFETYAMHSGPQPEATVWISDPPALAPAADAPLVELAFGYSRFVVGIGADGSGGRAGDFTRQALAGHPSLREDQLVAELAEAEQAIARDLSFGTALAPTGSAESVEPDLVPAPRIEPLPVQGWSGMVIASRGAADERLEPRFHPLTDVAMRLECDAPLASGVTFCR